MVWVPVSATSVEERASGLATTGTVQATPTEDATVTALNKEKLKQEVTQLANQNDPAVLKSNKEKLDQEVQQLKDQNEQDFSVWLRTDVFVWLRTNAAILAVVIGGLIGLFRWLGDRRSEREQQADERFQSVIEGLGSKNAETRVGAAILLRTFVQSPYKRFHSQAFDLAVAHLRLRSAKLQSPDPTPSEPSSSLKPTLVIVFSKPFLQDRKQTDLIEPLPLDSLSRALITVFGESLPLAREWREKHPLPGASFTIPLGIVLLSLADYVQGSGPSEYPPVAGGLCIMLAHLRLAKLVRESRMLDAEKIQLDNADLVNADLRHAWLEQAFLREAELNGAKFVNAHLARAHLEKASLVGADLTGADLSGANLHDADLRGAKMDNNTNLSGTELEGAKYNTQKIQETDEKGQPVIDQQGNAVMIEPTQWPRGFDPDGAVDVAYSPPQSPVSPPAPSKSKDAQAPSVTSAQVNILTPDPYYWKAYSTHGSTTPAQANTPTPSIDESSAISSKPGNGAQAPSAPSVQRSIPTSDTGGSSAPSSQQGPGS
jgi:hypothetical protein